MPLPGGKAEAGAAAAVPRTAEELKRHFASSFTGKQLETWDGDGVVGGGGGGAAAAAAPAAAEEEEDDDEAAAERELAAELAEREQVAAYPYPYPYP